MKISLVKTVSLAIALSVAILSGCNSSPKTESPKIEAVNPTASTTQSISEQLIPEQAIAVASFINQEAGVAIKGTDPVAYFTQRKPVQGTAEFAYEWNGVNWYFANAENRDLFTQNPEKYAPKYGGHCAWAASQGKVADIDPTAWSIVDGSLYLNYNEDIQTRWEKNIPDFIAQADSKWGDVVQKNSSNP